MSWEAVDLGILVPAFLAGLIVLATHVPLGQQVLSRGIVFIDLAIAQVAGLGVIAAHYFGFELAGWTTQIAAVSAALLAALLLTYTERKRPEVQEALAASRVAELATPTLNPGESYQDLLADRSAFEDFDVEAAAARGLGAVRLNQLALEHLLGAR